MKNGLRMKSWKKGLKSGQRLVKSFRKIIQIYRKMGLKIGITTIISWI